MSKIGMAIEWLKEGKPVARLKWLNTEDLFIFKQVPSQIPAHIVPNMQSLPDSVKEQFQGVFEANLGINGIYYQNQIAVVKLNNNIDSYIPTTEDLFAEDWYEYK